MLIEEDLFQLLNLIVNNIHNHRLHRNVPMLKLLFNFHQLFQLIALAIDITNRFFGQFDYMKFFPVG